MEGKQLDTSDDKKKDAKKGAKKEVMKDDSSDSGMDSEGDVQVVQSFESGSDSDSDDVEIVTANDKLKSAGFFQKMYMKDTLAKDKKNIQAFREGESDEYNSEVDGDSIDIDTAEVNYDILEVHDTKTVYHKQTLT